MRELNKCVKTHLFNKMRAANQKREVFSGF